MVFFLRLFLPLLLGGAFGLGLFGASVFFGWFCSFVSV